MRNRTRVIVLAVLILINIAFLFFSEVEKGVSFNEELFVVADTSGISSVTILTSGGQVALQETKSGWQLNQKYEADRALIRVLLSIMSRVEVKKPVNESAENPIEVQISGDSPMSFRVWGNPTKTRTFFSLMGSEEVYEVSIPGYNEYVAGIFELNPDQWRDRMVMNESWRTIQRLTLDYQGSDENDFTIRFDENFYKMDKVSEIDSSAVVDYLNLFQYFQVNEWISEGRFPKYDSLSRTPPVATLIIESIKSEFPIILDIYPRIKNDAFHLLTGEDNTMMAVGQRRVQQIMKQPEDFGIIEN